ncbi:unnamed protein product, partial [Larinioides sclopetarius]
MQGNSLLRAQLSTARETLEVNSISLNVVIKKLEDIRKEK